MFIKEYYDERFITFHIVNAPKIKVEPDTIPKDQDFIFVRENFKEATPERLVFNNGKWHYYIYFSLEKDKKYNTLIGLPDTLNNLKNNNKAFKEVDGLMAINKDYAIEYSHMSKPNNNITLRK